MTTKDRNDITPDNSVDFVEQKLRDIFDVVPVSIQPLKGHVDQNFLVEIDNAKFVFKLKEMKEGIFIEEFKSQIRFMMFLNGNGFVTPTIIPTLNGQMYHQEGGIIHADFHDSNIILLSQPRHKDPKGKYGIIDYGETIASLFLFDVAITVSYFMMISTLDDFIERGACVLAGYLSKRSMSTGEKKAFFVCVCAAYCRELVLCNKDFHVQGRQNEYLMTSMATGWPQLKKLRTHPEEFHAVFEKVLDIGE
ncbi:hypothetical protein CAPTEDRAFT_169284 [Capitella teleta]|uniref:Uncharacterized protein n=1 Tax=Capitella teleta TaxID=283909 RepID=R7V7T2_CAPTE|nr:hypothetical protein CAPTEDRAFT_169284 [Capitella teleta]|eukprot:ELU12431.1 hypothetical protein CAPTEDRAFT_169284 [Capitella teleta]